MNPLISIITPAYNSSAFIDETVSAALAQTVTDFELIVVDDGSSDGTIDVVHRAAAGDPRVIVMTAPHGGPAAARNVGIGAARGRFVALLDSDDVWDPTYLAEQLAMLERHPEIAIVSANGVSRGGPLDGRPLWPDTRGCREVTLHEIVTSQCAVMVMAVFRREVVDAVGGFNPQFTGNEDYEFWIRAANAGFRILQNRRPLARYRRRSGSLSADEIRMLRGMMSVLDSVSRMEGPIANERGAIERHLRQLREEQVKAGLRLSLSQHNGLEAARGLKALADLRRSWGLSLAARLTMRWPRLLLRADDLRRSLRAA